VQNDIRGIIVLSVFIAGMTLGLSYFLMGEMGILGVGIGWTIGQTIVALVVGSIFAIKLWHRH